MCVLKEFRHQTVAIQISVSISKSKLKWLACEAQLQSSLYAPRIFLIHSSISLLLRFQSLLSP